ncbi:hypothetical protein BLNAU_6293 [Blattamonas nauphoetae]|uniref:Uncharacterized protein n=1 Tax=Blattamonas nauphoetae TaxID=2049346 RepID=A0ABQ9Y516_9EUKA|nr:hypothetical protein BLNAU_6293 [Blattamonas nauphoetae]
MGSSKYHPKKGDAMLQVCQFFPSIELDEGDSEFYAEMKVEPEDDVDIRLDKGTAFHGDDHVRPSTAFHLPQPKRNKKSLRTGQAHHSNDIGEKHLCTRTRSGSASHGEVKQRSFLCLVWMAVWEMIEDEFEVYQVAALLLPPGRPARCLEVVVVVWEAKDRLKAQDPLQSWKMMKKEKGVAAVGI